MYRIEGVSKSYVDLKVLDIISVEFAAGKTTCLLGPSGCGKTTVLKILAGIEVADSGTVEGFSGEDISFVFQEDRFIPWRTVAENLEFVLGKAAEGKENGIDQLLERVGLLKYRDYYPKKLSGGIRKRIGILRALIYSSSIMLMDEPLSSVDAANKKVMMDLIKEVAASENRTCIFVTHDIDEAIELSNRIVILSDKPAHVKAVLENSYIGNPSVEGMLEMRKKIEEQIVR